MGRWAWARGGDCGSTSPRSLDELAQLRTHTAHYSPVMIAPLSINSSHADCRPERLFFFWRGVRSSSVNEKLGGCFTSTRALEDDPAVPRSAYVSPEAIGDAQGGIVGALLYAGATFAAGAVVLSGGTIVAALVAATLVGGAGGIIGALLATWLGDHHGRYLQTQIDHGGLLLWVQTRDPQAEERALHILRRHSSQDVHVHTLSSKLQAPSDRRTKADPQPVSAI